MARPTRMITALVPTASVARDYQLLPGFGLRLPLTSEKITGVPKSKSKPKTPLESTNHENEPVKLLMLKDLANYPVILLKDGYLSQISAKLIEQSA